MTDVERADKLLNELRNFALNERKDSLKWEDKYTYKYHIKYNYTLNKLVVSSALYTQSLGGIYFSNPDIAKNVIKKYYDELIWYFTVYSKNDIISVQNNTQCCSLCNNDNLSDVGINDNRIALWGGNNKPEKEQKLKYCPKCGRKLKD